MPVFSSLREGDAMKKYYPMVVDLTSKKCLVVGGGAVAERKSESLLNAGADLTIVSPSITPRMRQWFTLQQVDWVPRAYSPVDGEGAVLVVAATQVKEVNYKVYLDAQERDQWINVVDQPELCTFTVPSTLNRGKLQIAISTMGASPSLAKKIRRDLEKKFGKEYAFYLEIMQQIRKTLKRDISDVNKRREIISELSSDTWIDYCKHHPTTVKNRMHQWIREHLKGEGEKSL